MFRLGSGRIRKHTEHNEQEVVSSDMCGCLGCMATCKPDQIIDWKQDPRRRARGVQDRTAVCPHCGDTLIIGDRSGYQISSAFLEAMRLR